jgi:mannose-6-phosphate isomerase-like protein (cupin superfamily)
MEAVKTGQPINLTKEKKDKSSINLKAMREKDREPVKGIFHFYEVPGGSMNFVYKKYKGDETERFDLIDGQIYTVPLGVAKHLNNDGWYPIHTFAQDESGGHAVRIGQKVRRFGFQSLEFIDIEELSNTSPIITVERI